jgi:hypothetical protein
VARKWKEKSWLLARWSLPLRMARVVAKSLFVSEKQGRQGHHGFHHFVHCHFDGFTHNKTNKNTKILTGNQFLSFFDMPDLKVGASWGRIKVC